MLKQEQRLQKHIDLQPANHASDGKLTLKWLQSEQLD